jgi:hypothetical protein
MAILLTKSQAKNNLTIGILISYVVILNGYQPVLPTIFKLFLSV